MSRLRQRNRVSDLFGSPSGDATRYRQITRRALVGFDAQELAALNGSFGSGRTTCRPQRAVAAIRRHRPAPPQRARARCSRRRSVSRTSRAGPSPPGSGSDDPAPGEARQPDLTRPQS